MTATSESNPDARKWKRRCLGVVCAWVLTSFLLSFAPIRAVVAYPLYAHQEDAKGEAAYVMAGGPAYWERLRVASDLYHQEQVPRILILEQLESSGYNYTRRQSDSRMQRAIDYLAMHGVPADRIGSVPVIPDAAFGSLSEARSLARSYPDLERLVIVTSAPHTRRSLLCFQRVLPPGHTVEVYSASSLSESDEITSPIWIEYVKLAVYLVVA